jgi:hypothetical protein
MNCPLLACFNAKQTLVFVEFVSLESTMSSESMTHTELDITGKMGLGETKI